MPERDWAKDWERCQKASPLPWEAVLLNDFTDASYVETGCCDLVADRRAFGGDLTEEDQTQIHNDILFAAEAREALPYWLQRVKELEQKVWALEFENNSLKRELEELRELDHKRNQENREACVLLTGVDPGQERSAGWLRYEVSVVDLAKRIKKLEEENQELRRQLQEEEWFHKDREEAAASYIAELEQKIEKLEAVAGAAKEFFEKCVCSECIPRKVVLGEKSDVDDCEQCPMTEMERALKDLGMLKEAKD